MADSWAIDAGKLRKRVQIQSSTETIDGVNQRNPSWSTIDTRWMSIDPASGQHFTATDEIRALTTHKVVLRYYQGLKVTHRFFYVDPADPDNPRIFSILSILDEGEMHVKHTVLCQEVLSV
jgi:head-tail adaptor